MNGMFELWYEADAAGGAGGAGEEPPVTEPKETPFATWIKTQSQDVQDAYAADIAGLKSGLQKERSNGDQLKKAQARLKELEDAEAARARDKQTKEEQLSTDLATAQAKAATAENLLKDLQIRHAVEREAQKLNFNDPADAIKMIDLSTLTLEDGVVKGAKEALEGLAKTKPYLVKAVDKKDPGNRTDKRLRSSANEETPGPHKPLVHL